jgi:hypothetical protein
MFLCFAFRFFLSIADSSSSWRRSDAFAIASDYSANDAAPTYEEE